MIEEINLPCIKSLDIFIEGCTKRRGSNRNKRSALVKVWAPGVVGRMISGVCWMCVNREIFERRYHSRERIKASSLLLVNLI
jgi:hypothetical protein